MTRRLATMGAITLVAGATLWLTDRWRKKRAAALRQDAVQLAVAHVAGEQEIAADELGRRYVAEILQIDAHQVSVWRKTRHAVGHACLVWGTTANDVQCGENALKGVVAARGLGRDVERLTADEWTSLASYLLNARTDADKWQVDPKECGAKLETPSHLQRPGGGLTLTMLDRSGKTYSFGYEIHRIVVEVDTNDAVRVTTTLLCDVGDDL